MDRILPRILIRWVANSFGLWIAGRLLVSVDHANDFGVIIAAGLVLSLVNALIKPLVIILALPAIVFSLGLFMIIINGLMVFLVSELVGSFQIDSFGAAVLAGAIIGLVNYSITTVLGDLQTK